MAAAHARVEVVVQWADMDALGHVNNARYFTWIESARIALFERIGVMTSGPSEVGPILATTTCDFLAPVKYPARLEVTATITKVGETSLTMNYEAHEGDRLHARGTSVAVLVDYATSTKVRIPDPIRETIRALD